MSDEKPAPWGSIRHAAETFDAPDPVMNAIEFGDIAQGVDRSKIAMVWAIYMSAIEDADNIAADIEDKRAKDEERGVVPSTPNELMRLHVARMMVIAQAAILLQLGFTIEQLRSVYPDLEWRGE